MNSGDTFAGCTAPNISNWARTYLEAYPAVYNLPCGMGSPDYPVYVIVINSSLSFNSTQLQHIRRHEMGRALGLHEANVACWFDVVWYPLMNNGTFGNCSAFPQNATPTSNEAYWAAQWGFFD